MTKSLGAMVIAIFVACTVGAVPPSWGDDAGAAGFSCIDPPVLHSNPGAAGFSFRSPIASLLPNVQVPPGSGIDPGAAGFSFRPPTTGFLSYLPSRSTETPSLGYPGGAFGVGSISSGMVYHGVSPAGIVRYEQHSSASGIFSFTASYSYQSQFTSSGMTDLFSGFAFFP
jgi:hypothetical protein